MEPDDLLCARNARPEKALVGRAQWKINQPPSLEIARDLRKIGGAARPSFLLAEAARSECVPSMRAVKDWLAVHTRANWRKFLALLVGLSWEASLTHVKKCMTMLENPACRNMKAVGIDRAERHGPRSSFNSWADYAKNTGVWHGGQLGLFT